MLRSHARIQRQTLQLLDVGITIASFALAFVIRAKVLTFLPPFHIAHWDRYLLPVALVGVLWWIGFRWQGTYIAQRFTSLKTEFDRVLRAVVWGTLVFLGLVFLLKWFFVPRTLVLTFVPIHIVLLFLNCVLISGFIQWARSKGHDRKRVVIVGTGDRARRFVESMVESNERKEFCRNEKSEVRGQRLHYAPRETHNSFRKKHAQGPASASIGPQ